TESNDSWSKYAWKLTLRNDSDQLQVFRGTIEFQDSDAFIVDTDNVYDMQVPAKSEQVFTGYALIRAAVAGKVAQTVAKIGRVTGPAPEFQVPVVTRMKEINTPQSEIPTASNNAAW